MSINYTLLKYVPIYAHLNYTIYQWHVSWLKYCLCAIICHFHTLVYRVLHNCVFGGFHFQNPDYMKDGFHITLESLLLAERGETENVSNSVNILVLEQRHFLYWYTCNAVTRCWFRHVGKVNMVRPWKSPN